MTNKVYVRSDLQLDNLIYLQNRRMFCDAWDIMFFNDLYFVMLIISFTTQKIYSIDNKQYVQKTLP